MTAVVPFTTTRLMLRLHRPALYVWAGVFLVAGALLLWLYGPLTDASAAGWQQYNRCAMSACSYDQDAILTYKSLVQYTTLAVNVVPFLVAAWAGASLTGRELETGTAQLAWTQSISPARWLAVKLAVPAALVTAGTSVLVLLHNLVWSRGRGKIDNAKSWTDLLTFHANGTTTVAFALFGLAAGALAGLLLRRSLASLAVTVAATGAVWAAVSVARPYLWPSVTTVTGLADDAPAASASLSTKGSSPRPAPASPTPIAAAAAPPSAATCTTGSAPSATTPTPTPSPTTGPSSSRRPPWYSPSPRSQSWPPSVC